MFSSLHNGKIYQSVAQ